MKKTFKLKKSTIILCSIFIVCIILNILSWKSVQFSDWHRKYIFPIIQNVCSRISGIFPFSVGVIMIILGIILVIGGIFSYTILMIIKKGKRKRISILYGKMFAWILAWLFTVETTNFFMLYHCTSFADTYGISTNEYTPDQLYKVAEMMIEKANAASENVQRTEEGYYVLSSNLHDGAKKAMQKLGDEYTIFSGYYPNPKPVFTDIMTKLNLLGIYFPFSFEANYNYFMYPSDQPSTACHELVHLKGWILEDEANFVSYLACINSDNPDFVYSGYVDAMEWLWIKVNSECHLSDDEYAEFVDKIDPMIRYDCYKSHEIFQAAKQDKFGEIMSEVSDTAIEASLKFNGVQDGAKSYGRFVDLLLNYYLDEDGNLRAEV